MRRTSVIATLAAGLAAAGALAALAGGKPPATTLTLKATSYLTHAKVVDNAPSDRSAGDVLVFTEDIRKGGKVIGHDAATCTALFDARSLCTGEYSLSGGQLFVSLVQPKISGTLTYQQAITGGTGRFARAAGTVTVHQSPNGDKFTFRVRLRS